MCGIAGIVSLEEPLFDLPTKIDVVQRMVAEQFHRGPDDSGLWNNDYCIFGHRRLSVLDLTSAGRQPMCSDINSNFVITYNGEIYNYIDLKSQLVSRGYRFVTETDTEVLLRSYEEWGIDCVNKLYGMFAFAIWDNQRRRLVLARDRIGTKPLFYTYLSNTVSFASEIQSLLTNPEVPTELDWRGIDTYLSLGYIPSPDSGFSAIKKLPPGHVAIFDSSKVVNRYSFWSLSYLPKQKTNENEAIQVLQDKVQAAVKRRMICDVPFGAFLSGGIDSSIVVGLMAQQSSRQINTFSVGFDDVRFNELDYARLVARKWSTNHNEYICGTEILQNLPNLVRHFGEPFADISAVPTLFLASMTSKQVKVVLTGDGGDESFAGYDRYLANNFAHTLQLIPGGPTFCGAVSAILKQIGERNSYFYKISHKYQLFCHKIGLQMRERYPSWMSYFNEQQKDELYKEEYNIRSSTYLQALVDNFSNLHPLDMGMAIDVVSYLPDDLLVKLDITTMAHGLEARSPFLDHPLMEYAATLPTNLKARYGQKKYLLRKAFAHIIPPEIHRRPKMGFGIPVGTWFRGPLKKLLCEVLLDQKSTIFRQDIVEKYIATHLNSTADHSFQLWNLLILTLWINSVKAIRRHDS